MYTIRLEETPEGWWLAHCTGEQTDFYADGDTAAEVLAILAGWLPRSSPEEAPTARATGGEECRRLGMPTCDASPPQQPPHCHAERIADE